MRAFLFLLIAAVAATMLWAIDSESYQNGVVFTLCTLAVGLCGYLLSDYFFNIEKKTLKQDILAANRDVQALKDEKDLLQTQFNLATPHAQVEQLEQQLSFSDEQRNKLDGLTRAQYAEISGLKSQLEMQKKNYQKLFEEGAIVAENHNAQLIALQDTLASAREKIKYLTDEGEYLRNKILKLQTEAEEATIQKVVAEANEAAAATQLPKVVIHIPQNEPSVENAHVPNASNERGLLQMADPRAVKSREVEAPVIEAKTLVEEPIIATESIVETPIIEAETIVETPIIEAETIVETPIIEAEAIVETPIIESETIVETPIIEAETIVETPIIESETIVETPIIEAEPIIETPIIEAETIVETPIIEAETIVETPIIEAETIVETPIIEAESIVETPIIEADSISYDALEAELSLEKPVIAAAITENNVAETPQKVQTTTYVTSRLISPSFKTSTRSMDTAGNSTDNTDTIAVETPVISTDSTNLQAIQGIDKEIERILKSAGIDNWQEISETTTSRLQEILSDGNIHNVDVSNWSVQAILLADGHVNRLKTYLANLQK